MHNDFDIEQAIAQLTDATVISITKLVGYANETHAVELSDGERMVVRILIILARNSDNGRRENRRRR